MKYLELFYSEKKIFISNRILIDTIKQNLVIYKNFKFKTFKTITFYLKNTFFLFNIQKKKGNQNKNKRNNILIIVY